MTALYFLSNEYRAAALKLADLELDEVTISDTLESIGGDLTLKCESVAYIVRAMEADASAIKQWSKDAADRARAGRQ